MNIAFTLTDVQDLFLYGYLIDLYVSRGHQVYVYYDKLTNKITSPKHNKAILQRLRGCCVVPYARQNDCLERIKADRIEVIMTNEGMPFRHPVSLPCRMYAFAWTTEFIDANHGARFMPICDVFFCDDIILKDLYDYKRYPKLKVEYDCHPKYLYLNKPDSELYALLGLETGHKYVTVFGPAPSLIYEPKQKDIAKLVNYFAKQHFKIIYKHKPKDKIIKIFHYDVRMSHVLPRCSTSVILSYISDVVIGFNTSGILESVHTRTPFINFFLRHKKIDYRKHVQFKINTDFILRVDDYDKHRIEDFVNRNNNLAKRTSYPLSRELDI